MEETNVQAENSNTAEEVVLETTEDTSDNSQNDSESVEEIKSRLAKVEQLANNYKIRAEKAERKSKEQPKAESKTESSVSTKDLYALSKANIDEDDISEVESFAKFKGISISEALKTSTLKAILMEKKENRSVAQASNTGTARRSSVKQSDETLSERASKGDLPDSQDDIARLIKFRKGIK